MPSCQLPRSSRSSPASTKPNSGLAADLEPGQVSGCYSRQFWGSCSPTHVKIGLQNDPEAFLELFEHAPQSILVANCRVCALYIAVPVRRSLAHNPTALSHQPARVSGPEVGKSPALLYTGTQWVWPPIRLCTIALRHLLIWLLAEVCRQMQSVFKKNKNLMSLFF